MRSPARSFSFAFEEELTAWENLLYAARVYGTAGGGLRRRVEEALARFGRDVAGVAPDLGALTAMGVLLVPLGLLAFGWAERRAKRLGLLKRSG